MVENEKAAWNHEDCLGQLEFVPRWNWNSGFEKMDRLVAEKADSATSKPWKFWARRKTITSHQLSQLIERIAAHLEPPFVSLFDQTEIVPMALDDYAGFDADKRKASRHVVLFGGLKNETVAAAIQFSKSRNRRFSVCDDLCENRNDVPAFRELGEFVQSRSRLRYHWVDAIARNPATIFLPCGVRTDSG